MTAGRESLLINGAAGNAVWSDPRLTPSEVADAPTIFETSRSHEVPDLIALPEGADLGVEPCGGAYSLRLGGERRRVYVSERRRVCVRRFDYITFTSDEEARYAFLTLRREVERPGSAPEVERDAARRPDGRRRKRSEV